MWQEFQFSLLFECQFCWLNFVQYFSDLHTGCSLQSSPPLRTIIVLPDVFEMRLNRFSTVSASFAISYSSFLSKVFLLQSQAAFYSDANSRFPAPSIYQLWRLSKKRRKEEENLLPLSSFQDRRRRRRRQTKSDESVVRPRLLSMSTALHTSSRRANITKTRRPTKQSQFKRIQFSTVMLNN